MSKWLAQRFDRAVRWRADEEISARVLPVVDERVRQSANEFAWAVNELQRLGPQLASLEARVESQRQSREAPVPGAVPTEIDLLSAIRAEHEQVRARLFTVTRYVERLESLEAQVADLAFERGVRRP